VELKELPVIVGKEDDKFSATQIRKSKEYMISGKWIPSVVSKDDKMRIIEIVTPQEEPSIEDKMLDAVDEVFENFFPSKKKQVTVDLTGYKFGGPVTESMLLQKALHEVTLSTSNAVEVEGGAFKGLFKVGETVFEYDIKSMDSPYEDGEKLYNIGFQRQDNPSMVPTGQTSSKDYIKILSTMYKVILTFVEKFQPEYFGIASLDSPQGKNYHTVYNSLTDNKANNIPGYFRKDANVPFNDRALGTGRMIIMKKKKKVQPLDENVTGVPIQASSAISSKDREELVNVYDQLRDQLDKAKFNVDFQQDRIYITRVQDSQTGFDYTPYQKALPENEEKKFDYKPYIASLLEYMIDQGMKITPIPNIKTVEDPEQANNIFGKTAYYDPNNKEVVLYILGRNPKDVLRSFSHEMVHHMQNLQGRLGNIQTANTNEDDHLQEIEKEAYLKGNITFRNWEDGIKNG
jgi:hypothetical protein